MHLALAGKLRVLVSWPVGTIASRAKKKMEFRSFSYIHDVSHTWYTTAGPQVSILIFCTCTKQVHFDLDSCLPDQLVSGKPAMRSPTAEQHHHETYPRHKGASIRDTAACLPGPRARCSEP